MSFDWHTRYHQDALDGMLMLTLEERGAYNTCLDLIYSRRGPIPDDARWLSGWMGCSLKRWKTLRATLIFKGKLFDLSFNGGACLMNQRAAQELSEADNRARNSRETGAKGAQKRWENERAAKENKELDIGGLKGASSYRHYIDSKKIEDANASLSPASPRHLPDELFEQVWKSYPHIRGRSSKSKSLAAWRRLSVPVRNRLPSAVLRYSREGREPKADCGAPALDRWLRDERFLDWLDEPSPSAERVTEAEQSRRLQHFRDTREWKSQWGERPKDAA